MNKYIAKKVSLNTMSECTERGCSCFTRNGYYIQYRNGNVDSMLFVCENCFEQKYRSKCTIGSFDADSYIRQTNTKRYSSVHPFLRNLFCWTSQGTKIARMAVAVIALTLVIAFCVKEQPEFQMKFCIPEMHMEINTEIHVALKGMEHWNDRVSLVSGQISKVLTNGGKRNDQ